MHADPCLVWMGGVCQSTVETGGWTRHVQAAISLSHDLYTTLPRARHTVNQTRADDVVSYVVYEYKSRKAWDESGLDLQTLARLEGYRICFGAPVHCCCAPSRIGTFGANDCVCPDLGGEEAEGG